MEIVIGCLRALERPTIFLSPFVLTQHKNPYWFFIFNSVVDALQQVVVPAQFHFIKIEVGLRPKIYFTDFSSAASMAADYDHQARFAASSLSAAAFPDADVVPQ